MQQLGITGQTRGSRAATGGGTSAASGPARMAARVLVPLALLSLPACVTQNIQFKPPQNYPPAIEPSANDSPLIRLDLLTGTGDGGTGAGDIVLDVTVRDPNVSDALTYRVFRNFQPSDPLVGPVQERAVPSDDDGDGERALRVVLDRGLFTADPCNRVELLVSQRFQTVPNQREPVLEGDLGTRTWFVVADGSVSIDRCSWFHVNP